MTFATTAQVVIGGQFGDEGKGRLIDHYAASAGGDCMVVRFNGGAQAGHSVVTPEGRRHVFSHIGSGAFAGAATFLSRFFVANPILFLKEWQALAELGVTPTVWIDPASPATTPYDMLINQIIEKARGAGRHGSCGIGFGETLERQLDPAYALTVADLADAALADRLNAIRRDYAPARLARLGLGGSDVREAELLQSDALLERYIEDVRRFLDAVTVMSAPAAIQNRRILFEGAQGLLLDQQRGFFPYVTRSHTGLRNVLALASEWRLTRLEVTYATRVYQTRHGAGPLPGELSEKPYPGVTDPTNIPNDYQGALRFAWLNLDSLGAAIAADLSDARLTPEIALDPRLALTCLDQLGDRPAAYYQGGRLRRAGLETLLAAVRPATTLNPVWLGWGPERGALRDYL